MQMELKRKILELLGLVAVLAFRAVAAGENQIGLGDVMGNPKDSIAPMLPEIKWLFGTVYGWVFLAILICVAIAIIKYAHGTLTSNAATKQSGSSALIEIIGITFGGIVATGVVVFLFNTFIFK